MQEPQSFCSTPPTPPPPSQFKAESSDTPSSSRDRLGPQLVRRFQSFGLRPGFWDLHTPAGLKEDRKSPPKLTLKGPESPTCAAAAEGPVGPAPGFRRGLHSPPRSRGSRQSREPLLGSPSGNLRAPCAPEPLPQTLKQAVPKARRACALPSGATDPVAVPARPPALPYLPGAPDSSSVGAARVAQLRSRLGSLGFVPLPPAPALTTSPSFSHHVRTSGPSGNTAVQHPGGPAGPGAWPGTG